MFPTEFTPEVDGAPLVNTIFVRSTGSDVTGDGSLSNPLATLQFAITKVPFFIPAGQVFRIDITGIDELLPSDYTLPAWKAPATNEVPAPVVGIPGPNPFTIFQAAVEIFATPQAVAAIPFADTIINAGDIASVTVDPLTQLRTVNLVTPRASWTTANLLGKQVIDAASAESNSVIGRVNSTSSILLTIANAPTFPLQIVEPSATLHGSGTDFGTIRANNIDSIGFTGISILSDNGFNGLFADGNGTCMCQMSNLDSPFMAQQSGSVTFSTNNRAIKSHIFNFPTFAGPTLIGEALLDAVFMNPVMFSTPIILTLLRMVITGSDPVEVATYEPLTGAGDGAGPAHISINHVLFENGNGDGFIFHGVKGHVANTDFSGNAGNGITVERGGGLLALSNVGSSTPNVGFGISITDGMQVLADVDTTTTNPLALRGLTGTLGGDISLGSVGPVAWATVAAPPNNVPDYTGPAATGARIAQD